MTPQQGTSAVHLNKQTNKRPSEEMDGTNPKVAYFEITGLDDYHIGMDISSSIYGRVKKKLVPLLCVGQFECSFHILRVPWAYALYTLDFSRMSLKGPNALSFYRS